MKQATAIITAISKPVFEGLIETLSIIGLFMMGLYLKLKSEGKRM